ncbi:hypothetical protein KR032_010874, partial [Drosophila birchii]
QSSVFSSKHSVIMVPIRFLFLAVASVALIGGSQSANILGLFPSLSPSHLIIQMSVAKVLAEKGHNVTVVTVLKPVVNHKSINVITVPLTKEEAQQMSDTIKEMSRSDNSNMVLAMLRMSGQMDFMFKKMAEALQQDTVRDLYLNKDNKFDLVLSGYFMNDFQLGFARKVNAPVIIVATMPPNQMLNPFIGNPLEVSYVPSMDDSIEKGKGMSFRQRMRGLVASLSFRVLQYIFDRNNRNLYKDLFADDPSMPELSELTKNTSMIFFASHALSEGPIRPNVPAAIEIGGIQVKDKPDPLPQNMADFLGNATNGAILLSLGSNVKGSHIRPDTVTKMFNVLSKLKQRVIWKWEDLEQTPGQSDNILYSKWLPQDDILAHPKVKLFINHAGKGGITEAQYHGKPMLSLPVFGDQPGNAEGMVKKGFGLTQSLLTLEEQPFLEAIQEILTNPKYAQKVATFSSLYRDRPMSSRELVVYWSEYVIRHHGAAHLQSPLVHMNCIAANNLDLYALIAVILVVILLLFKALVKCIYRKIVSKSKTAKKQKTH